MNIRHRCLLLMPLLLLAGCGGSSGSGSNVTPSHVRMLDDFADVASVTGKVGSKTFLNSKPFATISAYADGPIVASNFSFLDASNSSLLVSSNNALTGGNLYTAYGVGSAGKGRNIVIAQDANVPVSGMALVRFLNLDEDDTSLDVYVTSTSVNALSTEVPQDTAVAYLSGPTTYVSIAPGTYRIWFTQAGDPATVIVRNDVALTANLIETLPAIQSGSGVIIQEVADGPSA